MSRLQRLASSATLVRLALALLVAAGCAVTTVEAGPKNTLPKVMNLINQAKAANNKGLLAEAQKYAYEAKDVDALLAVAVAYDGFGDKFMLRWNYDLAFTTAYDWAIYEASRPGSGSDWWYGWGALVKVEKFKPVVMTGDGGPGTSRYFAKLAATKLKDQYNQKIPQVFNGVWKNANNPSDSGVKLTQYGKLIVGSCVRNGATINYKFEIIDIAWGAGVPGSVVRLRGTATTVGSKFPPSEWWLELDLRDSNTLKISGFFHTQSGTPTFKSAWKRS